MSRPTTDPYAWATDAGTREAVSALLQSSGWVAGEPVPDGLFNGLLGVASDWLRWQARRARVKTFRTGLAVPVTVAGDVAAATTGTLQTSEPAASVTGFGVRLYNDGGASAYSAAFPGALFMDGDSVSAIAIDMSAVLVSSADGDVSVSIADHEGNVVVYNAVPTNSTGELVLTYDSAASIGTGTSAEVLDGWVDVYFSFQVSATAGDFLDIASIAIAI